MGDCNNPCQKIICQVPDDLSSYSLQTPKAEPTVLNPFVNDRVILVNLCPDGETPSTDSPLPSWVTLDADNNQLIGASGVFSGLTQAAANAAALTALQEVLRNINLICITPIDCGSTPQLLADLVWNVPGGFPYNVTPSGDHVDFDLAAVPGVFSEQSVDSAICNSTNEDKTLQMSFVGLSFGGQVGRIVGNGQTMLQVNFGGFTIGPQSITFNVPANSITTFSVSFYADNGEGFNAQGQILLSFI